MAGANASFRVRRAFTLIELVVVVVILGILSVIATVQFAGYTDRARDAAAMVQVSSLTRMAVMTATATGTSSETLTTSMFSAALGTFSDAPAPIALGTHAGGANWALLGADVTPTNKFQFSIGFDDGLGGDLGVNNESGTRAVVVARSDSGRFFASIALAAPMGHDVTVAACQTFTGANAADVLAGHCYVDPVPVPDIARIIPVPDPSPTTTPAPDPSTTPVPDPSTPAPVPAPIAPPINWNTCETTANSGPTRATVTEAYIATHGNSAVSWTVSGPTTGIAGFKVCEVDQSTGATFLVAATGNGTGSTRSWLVPTYTSHVNVFLEVVTVLTDGSEIPATNSCEVAPAGAAKGWYMTHGCSTP